MKNGLGCSGWSRQPRRRQRQAAHCRVTTTLTYSEQVQKNSTNSMLNAYKIRIYFFLYYNKIFSIKTDLTGFGLLYIRLNSVFKKFSVYIQIKTSTKFTKPLQFTGTGAQVVINHKGNLSLQVEEKLHELVGVLITYLRYSFSLKQTCCTQKNYSVKRHMVFSWRY